MPYLDSEKLDSLAKSDNLQEIEEYWNKNKHLWSWDAIKSTKTRKNTKSTVKTAKTVKNDAKLATTGALKAYIEGTDRTDSIPNPNQAFKDKKEGKMSVLEYLEQAGRLADRYGKNNVDR